MLNGCVPTLAWETGFERKTRGETLLWTMNFGLFRGSGFEVAVVVPGGERSCEQLTNTVNASKKRLQGSCGKTLISCDSNQINIKGRKGLSMSV